MGFENLKTVSCVCTGVLGEDVYKRQYIDSCIVIPPPSVEEKMTVMLKHIAKMVEYKG